MRPLRLLDLREIRGLGFAAEWVIWLSDYTASKALSRAENEAFDILGNPWQKPAQSNRLERFDFSMKSQNRPKFILSINFSEI